MNKRSIVSYIGMLTLILVTGITFAGTTGKIAGLVVDKESGEGLAGVNVYLEGTSLGAATDLEGYYQVISIPPGSYTLTVSMIGYGTVSVENIKIQVDRTTTQNIELTTETLETETVVVVADRPLVERDRTNTAAYVNSETIDLMPVQDVKEVVQLQAGVITGADGQLHIRGGRSREISYMVDGVSVTNGFSQDGGSNVRMENAFIEELQVITGTFNAEYGSAQSGIINVVTKRPQSEFKAQAEVFVGDYWSDKTDRFIGISDFDPLGERDIQVTLSGPVLSDKLSYFISARNYKRDGYLFGERRYNPVDGWTIDAYRHWYTERFAGQVTEEGRIEIPDSLTTGDGAAVPMAKSELFSIVGKLTYAPLPNLGFTYSLFASQSEGQGYSDNWRYAPDGRNMGYGSSQSHFLAFRHSVTNSIFYNLRFSYQYNDSESYLRDDLEIADYPGDDGYLPLGASDDQTGFVQGDNEWGRSKTKRELIMINGDFNWQIDRFNLVKLGFEFRQHKIKYHNQPLVETTQWQSNKYTTAISGKGLEFYEYMEAMNNFWRNWSTFTGVPKLREANETDGSYVDYTREPIEFAAYAQDKIELGDLVINAGLRLDFFDPNAYTLINKRESIR